jgi:hypothetical protein
MGFINAGKAETKAEEPETETARLVTSGGPEKTSGAAPIPKLWRPTPTRDYVPTAADFGAMAILSRQYSIFGAAAAAAASATTTLSTPTQWKTNLLTSALFSSMQQDPFHVSSLGVDVIKLLFCPRRRRWGKIRAASPVREP